MFFIYFLFILLRDLRAPSADRRETLPHDCMIALWVRFNADPLMPPLKILGQNMQNVGRFYTISDFNCKCLRNESRYPKSEQHDCDRGWFLPCLAKEVRWSYFGPVTTKYMWVWTNPNVLFRETVETTFRPLGYWSLKFLHALEIHQGV